MTVQTYLCLVTYGNGGWTFVKHLGWGKPVCDSVNVPFEFLDRVAGALPPNLQMAVCIGYYVTEISVFAFEEARVEAPIMPKPFGNGVAGDLSENICY
ncbi:hypothetical protein AgCh_033850 [Apium graveolens]